MLQKFLDVAQEYFFYVLLEFYLLNVKKKLAMQISGLRLFQAKHGADTKDLRQD